jgi:transposase-like protein
MKAKRRVYTTEFRQEALGLWSRSGKSANEIEQELGITHGLLDKWQKRYKANKANWISRDLVESGERSNEVGFKLLRTEIA